MYKRYKTIRLAVVTNGFKGQRQMAYFEKRKTQEQKIWSESYLRNVNACFRNYIHMELNDQSVTVKVLLINSFNPSGKTDLMWT